MRLGMGPCQGGFCTYRATGILHALRRPDVEDSNVALRDFLQERWKGLTPILWGSQLKQERLNELIYLSVLNADHLPGPAASRLGPAMYDKGSVEERPEHAKT
jgi:glycerol-3-phosphate dehydrogenase